MADGESGGGRVSSDSGAVDLFPAENPPVRERSSMRSLRTATLLHDAEMGDGSEAWERVNPFSQDAGAAERGKSAESLWERAREWVNHHLWHKPLRIRLLYSFTALFLLRVTLIFLLAPSASDDPEGSLLLSSSSLDVESLADAKLAERVRQSFRNEAFNAEAQREIRVAIELRYCGCSEMAVEAAETATALLLQFPNATVAAKRSCLCRQANYARRHRLVAHAERASGNWEGDVDVWIAIGDVDEAPSFPWKRTGIALRVENRPKLILSYPALASAEVPYTWRWRLRSVDAMWVSHRAGARKLSAVGKQDQVRADVVPLAINASTCDPTHIEPLQLADIVKMSLPVYDRSPDEDSFLLVHRSRFAVRSGIYSLLKALEDLETEPSGVCAILVIDGIDKSQRREVVKRLRKLVSCRNCCVRVAFAMDFSRGDWHSLVRGVHAYVASEPAQSSPFFALEAACVGKPLIGPVCGGLASVFSVGDVKTFPVKAKAALHSRATTGYSTYAYQAQRKEVECECDIDSLRSAVGAALRAWKDVSSFGSPMRQHLAIAGRFGLSVAGQAMAAKVLQLLQTRSDDEAFVSARRASPRKTRAPSYSSYSQRAARLRELRRRALYRRRARRA